MYQTHHSSNLMFASYGLIKLNGTWFSEPSRQRHRLQRHRATTLARWPKRATKMSTHAPLAAFAGGRGHGLSMMPSLGIIGPLWPSQSARDGRPPGCGVSIIVAGSGEVSNRLDIARARAKKNWFRITLGESMAEKTMEATNRWNLRSLGSQRVMGQWP